VFRSFVSKTRAKILKYIKKLKNFFPDFLAKKCHNFWTCQLILIILVPVDVTFYDLSSGIQHDWFWWKNVNPSLEVRPWPRGWLPRYQVLNFSKIFFHIQILRWVFSYTHLKTYPQKFSFKTLNVKIKKYSKEFRPNIQGEF
jgi:hypothetical protein